MGFHAIFFLFLLACTVDAEISRKIGINYGQLGNNLPSPSASIEHIRTIKAGLVKLYDANPDILKLLSGTNLHVSIMIPNHEISNISSSQTAADQWILNHVLPYYPETMISFICIGNEVLSSNTEQDRKIWTNLVPAMRKIKNALAVYEIGNIKVGTPLAMDVFETTFPPSSAKFRSDISESVIIPMLDFLNRTKSYIFLDVYPYFSWSANPNQINLDFALFGGNQTVTDPISSLNYTNLLDQMLDSVIFATTKIGYPNLKLLISETGWPNSGDDGENGANICNAAIYNRRLVEKITAKPPIGTPARPGVVIPTFIFSLYDENQKNGPGTERHWGIFHPNGMPIYDVDLSGKRLSSEYEALPAAGRNGTCENV